MPDFRSTAPAFSIASAFGLSRPAGPLTPYRYRSSPTWILDTADARFLVKQVEVAGRESTVEHAARFERQVGAAGLAVPRPVPPVGPAVGFAAAVDGLDWVRLYHWIDGRDLADDEDVTGWLGATLAALHAIEPAAGPDPHTYGIRPVEQWHTWLADGTAQGRPWAPVLRAGLPDILDITTWLAAALDRAGDYVLTHRDIEPWNVMMTAAGPVLIDWDPAGPDSATLEAAHAAYSFADRGPAVTAAALRPTLVAYAAAGGRLRADDDLLARRVGLRLSRLGYRLARSTGAVASGPPEQADVDARAAEQIRGLPVFADRLRSLGATVAAHL